MKGISIFVLLPSLDWLWDLQAYVLVKVLHDLWISPVQYVFEPESNVEIGQVQHVGGIVHLQVSSEKRGLQGVHLVVDILELQG